MDCHVAYAPRNDEEGLPLGDFAMTERGDCRGAVTLRCLSGNCRDGNVIASTKCEANHSKYLAEFCR